MSTNLIGEAVANMGSFIVNGTTQVNKECDAIVVTDDAIFSKVLIAGVDKKADYIQDTSLTVKAGTILTPINDLKFSGVELVSGQVVLILG
jgi:hypothetical protein